MTKKTKWTINLLKEISQKYETKNEWKNKDNAAYNAARRRGSDFFNSCCSHMKNGKMKWTKEKLKSISLKYKTKIDWLSNDKTSYHAAFRRGKDFFEMCCSHMGRKTKWSKNEIKKDSLKYKSRSQWAKNSRAYHLAKTFGDIFLKNAVNIWENNGMNGMKMIFSMMLPNIQQKNVGN